MGYACPVCDVPQRDARHLADHLAFTAMLRHEEHEEWLDERVPEWGQQGPADLGAEVVEYAEETEYDEVFEDTVNRHDHHHDREESPFDDDHEHAHGSGHGGIDVSAADQRGSGGVDAETQHVLMEARELTRQMMESSGGEDGSESDESASSLSEPDE